MMLSLNNQILAFLLPRQVLLSMFTLSIFLLSHINRLLATLFSTVHLLLLMFFCNMSSLWFFLLLLLTMVTNCFIHLNILNSLLFLLKLSLNLTSLLCFQSFNRCILMHLLVRLMFRVSLIMVLGLCLFLYLLFGLLYSLNLMFTHLLLSSAIFGFGPSQRLVKLLCWRLFLLLIRLLGSILLLMIALLISRMHTLCLTLHWLIISMHLPSSLCSRFMLFVMVLIRLLFLAEDLLLLWFVQTFHPILISKFLLSLTLKLLALFHLLLLILLFMSFLLGLNLDLE